MAAPRPSAPGTPGLSIRLDLPGGRIGPGKVRLLELIAQEGSIAAAGRVLAMSYRRAWELVNETRQIMGGPVVEVAVGGARGGGAKLTPLGLSLVTRYRDMERRVTVATQAEMAAMIAELPAGDTPDSKS